MVKAVVCVVLVARGLLTATRSLVVDTTKTRAEAVRLPCGGRAAARGGRATAMLFMRHW